MGSWWSSLTKRDTRAPIKGIAPRIKNIAVNNFRGLLGFIVPVCVLSWQPQHMKHDITVKCMWMLMFWFFLLLPISLPCTAMIPIFILPMAGVMSTKDTCLCYFNDCICLFLLASMLRLLLNNCGTDRRFALSIIGSGDNCQFSGKRMVFKCSVASFFLAMFSNRLIVTSTLVQYITPIYTNLQASYAKSTTEPNYNEIRYIVNNAIHTSASIGSLGIMHSAVGTIAFRAAFSEAGPAGQEYEDIFNYLQYSFFAIPVACLMFIFNFSYHMILINKVTEKCMSLACMTDVRNQVLKHREAIPKDCTLHEKLSVFFLIFALLIFFTRWSKYVKWADYNLQEGIDNIPMVKDAVVAAMFVLIVHLLPKSFNFFQFYTAKKKSDITHMKPESAILWWKFVDRNTNYAYFFLLGAGIAIYKGAVSSGLADTLADNMGKSLITKHDKLVGLLLVCFIICLLSNIMSGMGAFVSFIPFVLCMTRGEENAWLKDTHLVALGVGMGSSLGFMWPFLYTPAYFCHHVGKVPKRKMAMYSFIPVIMCWIILWLALMYYAPVIWGREGYLPVPSPSSKGGAAPAPPPPPGGEDVPAPEP